MATGASNSGRSSLLCSIFLVVFGVLSRGSGVETAKILFAYPVAIRSHANVFLPIVEELASRGHQVTLFTTVKPNRELPASVRQVVPEALAGLFGLLERDSFAALKDPFNWSQLREAVKLPTTWCERIMGDETYRREFWDAPEDDYDLVVMSAFGNECLFGLVWRSQLPFVLVSPTGMFPWVGASMGNPSYAPAAPALFLVASSNRMNFWERLANWAVVYGYRLIYEFLTGPRTTAVLRRELPDIPSPGEITANASLLLLNTDISVDYPRPQLPNIKEIGGLHCRPAGPLPADLEEFVTKPGSKGFIYFSLGSTVKGVHMPKEFRRVFVEVFTKLSDYQILWKWEDDTVEGETLPPNVRLAKWLPQQDVLGHDRIRLFITQGGLLSTHEATFHGVPIVGLPVGSDQLLNMRRSVVAGVGLALTWEELTPAALHDAVARVLADPTFADNVRRRSAIMRDQETGPLDRAVFWIEHVLRHRGAPHLRSSLPELNWAQAHCLDVAAFLIAVVVAILAVTVWITVSCFRCIWSRLCRSTPKKHEQSNDPPQKNKNKRKKNV